MNDECHKMYVEDFKKAIGFMPAFKDAYIVDNGAL